MSEEVPDNVVVLDPAMAISMKPRGLECCRHKHVLVDENLRSVECTTCGAPMDPFAVLLDYARGTRSLRYQYEELRRRRKELYASVEQLAKDERNAKARVANARRKLKLMDTPGMDL